MKQMLVAITVSLIVAILTVHLASVTIVPDRVNVSFAEPACIRPYMENRFKTCCDTHVIIDGKPLLIPRGFNTDLASVPTWYQHVISPYDYNIITPAILHDYLYACPHGYSKEKIDDIFYYALTSSGVSTYTSFKMWAGVRLFGGSSVHDNLNCTRELRLGKATSIKNTN